MVRALLVLTLAIVLRMLLALIAPLLMLALAIVLRTLAMGVRTLFVVGALPAMRIISAPVTLAALIAILGLAGARTTVLAFGFAKRRV